MIRPALFALTPLICGGCFPITITTSPHIEGSIIDAATSRPVANATVVVHPGFPPKYDGTPTTVLTDMDGHFSVSEKSGRIWIPPVPFDPAYPYAKLSVSADGYGSVEDDLHDFMQGHFGEPVLVRLKHN